MRRTRGAQAEWEELDEAVNESDLLQKVVSKVFFLPVMDTLICILVLSLGVILFGVYPGDSFNLAEETRLFGGNVRGGPPSMQRTKYVPTAGPVGSVGAAPVVLGNANSHQQALNAFENNVEIFGF